MKFEFLIHHRSITAEKHFFFLIFIREKEVFWEFTFINSNFTTAMQQYNFCLAVYDDHYINIINDKSIHRKSLMNFSASFVY